MKSVEELLIDLVAIPSVSAMNNRAVIDYVVSCLDPELWETDLDEYLDSAGTPKVNLTALTRNASGNHAELALVCHSDTVPFESTWAEAVRFRAIPGVVEVTVAYASAAVFLDPDQADPDGQIGRAHV